MMRFTSVRKVVLLPDGSHRFAPVDQDWPEGGHRSFTKGVEVKTAEGTFRNAMLFADPNDEGPVTDQLRDWANRKMADDLRH